MVTGIDMNYPENTPLLPKMKTPMQKTNNKNPELKQVCRHIFFVKDFVL